jgi:hypothetical protein
MLPRHSLKTPIWPYIAVVACLFVLSLLAPHAWLRDTPAIPSSADRVTPAGPPGFDTRQASAPKFVAPKVVAPQQVEESEPIEFNPPEVAGTVLAGPVNTLPRSWAPSVELPAQVAPIHPPVAEQIKLDVSVMESPELPYNAVGRSELSSANSTIQEILSLPDVTGPLARQNSEPRAEVAGVLPYATDLIAALSELKSDPLCREWARDLVFVLEALPQMEDLGSSETEELFQRLLRRLSETPQLVEETRSLAVRTRLLRHGYAAKRRADVWHQVSRILSTGAPVSVANPSDMPQRLADVEERVIQAEHADAWRHYLLLDEVRGALGSGDSHQRCDVARRVLKRIDSPELSRSQAEILGKSPFHEFTLDLRRWASEPIDYRRLLNQIEEHEREGTTDSAAEIAQCYNVLRWSAEPDLKQLAELLNTHYRNANVRVALTADFLNRLLPDPQSYEQDVNGNIAGANVYGTSRTVNRLKVVLHPDGETWRIGLEAHGEVNSDTAASKGPATFYNQGFARYYARKLLMVDRRGIRVWRAETDANSQSELTGFETDFDPIPVIGWLARAVARSQHDQQSPSARAETEAMVRNEAGTRFDDEVHQRLSAAEEKVQKKLIGPFEKISLQPTALDMSTTEERVIARYRLAADNQLGAQTPRPQAPGDSLLSVQIHQSAMNNTLANLRLEGRRVELHALYRELGELFERPDLEAPEDIPEGVIIQFADKEAVRVLCDDSHVMLTIRIAELKSGRSKFSDFSVRAFYVPDSEQLKANLVREDTLQIIGDLSINERFPLRVIFSKVLSKARTFNLINQHLAENPHLSDCHVNQFVINDGWIGVGVGPVAEDDVSQLAKKRAADAR